MLKMLYCDKSLQFVMQQLPMRPIQFAFAQMRIVVA